MRFLRKRGVTLLELLVAMVVTTILLGVMYEVHRQFVQVSQRASGRVQHKREIRSVVEMMTRDFSALVRGADAAFWVNPPASDFSVMAMGLVKGEWGVSAVRYEWSGNKTKELRRSALSPGSTFQTWQAGASFQFPERFLPEKEEVLLEKINRFQIRFFHSHVWHEAGMLRGEAPKEVEIILEAGGSEKILEPYRIRVSIE